mmetsp:Transcript_2365/g.4657  ORF Transcript_2365/g.4657 Transcript_2365/m.4657 type:complete len:95 (+) Transcript_2365:68-352(+)
MGLFFALPEVTEGNVVKIPQSMLDDDDEIEDDMMGTRKGNKTIFTKKTTKHTKARGCCAGVRLGPRVQAMFCMVSVFLGGQILKCFTLKLGGQN